MGRVWQTTRKALVTVLLMMSLPLGSCATSTPTVDHPDLFISDMMEACIPSIPVLVHPDLFLSGITELDANAEPISSIEELIAINGNMRGSYYLTCDLDLSSYTEPWVAIGDFQHDFMGTLDGQGHIIKNLSSDGDDVLSSLFVMVGPSGVVKNLGLLECSIHSNAAMHIGGFCLINMGRISNCFVTGSLASSAHFSDSVSIGGVAESNTGSIELSYFAGSINLVSSDTSAKSICIGGVTGKNIGNIDRCFTLGRIDCEISTGGNRQGTQAPSVLESSIHIGGVTGLMTDGSIQDCANYASIMASSDIHFDLGGICGEVRAKSLPGATIKHCISAGNLETTGPMTCISGICGWAAGWGEISRCLVGMEHMRSLSEWHRISAIAQTDDGYWEEGMPVLIIHQNLISDDITLTWSLWGVTKVPRPVLSDLRQLSRHGIELDGFWGVLDLAGDASSGISYPVPIRIHDVLAGLDAYGYEVPAMQWDLSRDWQLQAGGQATGGSNNGGNSTGSGISDGARPYISDVEGEVVRIRDLWNTDRNAIAAGEFDTRQLDDGVTAFSADGKLRMIEVSRGSYGVDYMRIYQFEDGHLIFAYYENAEQNRLYFKDGWLFRWRFTDAGGNTTNHDNEPENPWYLDWEHRASDEAARLRRLY